MVPVFWPSATDVKTKSALNKSTRRIKFFFIAPPIDGVRTLNRETKACEMIEDGESLQNTLSAVATSMQAGNYAKNRESLQILVSWVTENLEEIQYCRHGTRGE